MRKGIKYALIFMGGVAVGIGVCGTNMISYALNDDDIRYALKKKITGKIDKTLFGSERDSKVSYRHYCNWRKNQNNTRYAFLYDEIIFDNRATAEHVKNEMTQKIYMYGYVTVADMYDIAGLSTTYMSNKYGWTSLEDAAIIRSRDGYYIKLPKVLPL